MSAAVEQRCERTELLKDQCAHCKGQRSVEEQVERESGEHRRKIDRRTYPGPWFFAMFDGKCVCGEGINSGEAIRAVEDGYQGYCCAEDEG